MDNKDLVILIIRVLCEIKQYLKIETPYNLYILLFLLLFTYIFYNVFFIVKLTFPMLIKVIISHLQAQKLILACFKMMIFLEETF